MAHSYPTHRVLICTVLPVEYLAVRAHLQDPEEIVHKEGTIYERGKFITSQKVWMVHIVQIATGNTSAALETERAIRHFNPEVICFVGTARGLKDVELGDVVVATKVYDYEAAKDGTSLLLRPEISHSTYRMVQRAQASAHQTNWLQRLRVSPNQPPRVFIGPIAAGNKIVGSYQSTTWKLLKQHFSDSLAVETESYGFLRTAYANHSVEALVIRGISHLIDNKSDAQTDNVQHIASQHASAFTFEVLSRLVLSDTQVETVKSKNITQTAASKYNININGSIGNIIQGDGHHITIDQNNKMAR